MYEPGICSENSQSNSSALYRVGPLARSFIIPVFFGTRTAIAHSRKKRSTSGRMLIQLGGISSSEGPVASAFWVCHETVTPSCGLGPVRWGYRLKAHSKCRDNQTLRQHLLLQAPAQLQTDELPELYRIEKGLKEFKVVEIWNVLQITMCVHITDAPSPQPEWMKASHGNQPCKAPRCCFDRSRCICLVRTSWLVRTPPWKMHKSKRWSCLQNVAAETTISAMSLMDGTALKVFDTIIAIQRWGPIASYSGRLSCNMSWFWVLLGRKGLFLVNSLHCVCGIEEERECEVTQKSESVCAAQFQKKPLK